MTANMGMQGKLAGVSYRGEPSVLLLADSRAGLERLHRLAALSGCRVSATGAVEEGLERLDAQIGADAVLVDLERDHGDAQDQLLDRLAAASNEGRYGSVVAAPAPLTDRVAARVLGSGVEHLCEPGERDWLFSVAPALRRPSPRLNDVNKSQGTARLQQLSEEVGRIATLLATLSEDEGIATAAAAVDAEEGENALDAGQIRAIIRARRLRDQFFRGDLFADPAWDMLLDLMAARLERQRVAVSSLCIAAAVPPTTALRWIKALCEQGLFVRVADPTDGRRVFIELSDQAASALSAYLKAAQRIAPAIL